MLLVGTPVHRWRQHLLFVFATRRNIFLGLFIILRVFGKLIFGGGDIHCQRLGLGELFWKSGDAIFRGRRGFFGDLGEVAASLGRGEMMVSEGNVYVGKLNINIFNSKFLTNGQ